MEEDEAADLLAESLEEEKTADELLNRIAEEVNQAAQSAESEDEEDEG